jgi:hypothetical protein
LEHDDAKNGHPAATPMRHGRRQSGVR